MNKMKLLHAVGAALLVSFIVQAITIIILVGKIKVPAMQTVFEIHEYNGLIMTVLVLAHIWLNWGWIKFNLFKIKK